MLIIPACGQATRISRIPKFLLPITSSKTLLNNILEIAKENNIENIWISTRPDYGQMVYDYTLGYKPNIKISITETMSQTIDEYRNLRQTGEQFYYMVMPDTYISDRLLFNKMKAKLEDNCDIVVGVWKIRDNQRGKLGQCLIDETNNRLLKVVDKDSSCPYPYSWGTIGWKNPEFWKHIDPKTSHIGYALQPSIDTGLVVGVVYMDDQYYDCGTIDEYSSLLTQIKLIENNSKEIDIQDEMNNKKEIFVFNNSSNKSGGAIFHYSHFIIDCLLPEIYSGVYRYDKIYRQKTFSQTIGNRKNIYMELFKKNNDTYLEVTDKPKNIETITIDSFGWFVTKNQKNYDVEKIIFCVNFIYQRLDIISDSKYPKIILIKRNHQEKLIDKDVIIIEKQKKRDIFTTNGIKRGCIKDIDQIDKYLSENYGQNYQQLILEDIESFREEVMYFYNAELVIGATGAGLTNVFWMRPKSSMIEVKCRNYGHMYQNIALVREIKSELCDNDPYIVINKIKEIAKTKKLI